eukprot:COSAG01_NODE_6774_length_3504_cov_27.969457_4_plen_126_part_00
MCEKQASLISHFVALNGCAIPRMSGIKAPNRQVDARLWHETYCSLAHKCYSFPCSSQHDASTSPSHINLRLIPVAALAGVVRILCTRALSTVDHANSAAALRPVAHLFPITVVCLRKPSIKRWKT